MESPLFYTDVKVEKVYCIFFFLIVLLSILFLQTDLDKKCLLALFQQIVFIIFWLLRY